MRRWAMSLFVLGIATAACSGGHGTSTPPAAAVLLLRAADQSSGRAATVQGLMSQDGTALVKFTGWIDVEHRAASLTFEDANTPARWEPFDVRTVNGWTYVQINAVFGRPPGLSPEAKWVAMAGNPRPFPRLPIPDRALAPTFLFVILDQIESGSSSNAAYVATGSAETEVRFQLRADAADKHARIVYTASIDRPTRIAKIVRDTRFVQHGTYHSRDEMSFKWVTYVPQVIAPPASDVQQLPPGTDLYAQPA